MIARRSFLVGFAGAMVQPWAGSISTKAAVDDLAERASVLAPERWLELTENAAGTRQCTRMADVFPPRNGHPAWGVIGPRGVMAAWNGGALDTKRMHLVVTSGGHSDYGGNEVHAFDLRALEWSRLTDPSSYDADFYTRDGTPISRHTYDGLEYLPNIDRLFMFGAALYPHGNRGDPVVWLFDFDRRLWRRGARIPFNGYPQTAYDAENRRVLFHRQDRLMAYDPLADRWKVLSLQESWLNVGVADIDWSTRKLVFLNPKGVHYYDLDRLLIARRFKAETGGDTEIERLPTPGLAYDPIRRRLVAWAGGRAVWSLDTRTFRWTRHDNRDGPAPSERDARGRMKTRGVFGRWRYVPGYDVFVGVNGTGDNVWLYKMPPFDG